MSSLRSTLLYGLVPYLLAILVAAAGCLGVAYWVKDKIEMAAMSGLELAFGQAGHDWTEIAVDGLTVELSGTAPDEATRFAALSTAGTVVDATRLIDNMNVVAAASLKAPDFAVEILKNDDGVSLIGLVPLSSDPETIVAGAKAIVGDARVSDLLEVADFPEPDRWASTLSYGIDVLDVLPRSKLSIAPGVLTIKAVAQSAEDKAELERRLTRGAPDSVRLILEISAPRPVVAPFTFRAVLDAAGGRFDACTADSEAALEQIENAAKAAGISGGASCILGLGTPSTRWGDAAESGLAALAEIGGGILTISNADVTLVAPEGTSESVFERATGTLEGALPPVFSLNAVLPKPAAAPVEGEAVAPEFVATRSPEGQVQLRGKLGDDLTRTAIESFAAAAFGSENVYPATLLTDGLPSGWPTRVMTALEALGHLNNGSVTVTLESIEVRGDTGDAQAQGEITRLISSTLGGAAAYELDITYRERLDPLAGLPTPDECVEQLNAAANARKITFAPSSSNIESNAQTTIDEIADVLRTCQDIRIEIGGHTDSQGREIMNQQLSQARADAVLNAIMARRVLVSNLTAKGYGESQPIADNETDEGREANRRIEFRLITESEEDEEVAEAAEDADAEESQESTE